VKCPLRHWSGSNSAASCAAGAPDGTLETYPEKNPRQPRRVCAPALVLTLDRVFRPSHQTARRRPGHSSSARHRTCGEFDAFKLRSMSVNAEEVLRSNPAMHQEFEKNSKLKNDPRITPLGAILRRLSPGELPQLLVVS